MQQADLNLDTEISLAFLTPDLVKAAIDGRLPRGMGVVRLTDMPAEWFRQHLMLGFNTYQTHLNFHPNDRITANGKSTC